MGRNQDHSSDPHRYFLSVPMMRKEKQIFLYTTPLLSAALALMVLAVSVQAEENPQLHITVVNTCTCEGPPGTYAVTVQFHQGIKPIKLSPGEKKKITLRKGRYDITVSAQNRPSFSVKVFLEQDSAIMIKTDGAISIQFQKHIPFKV